MEVVVPENQELVTCTLVISVCAKIPNAPLIIVKSEMKTVDVCVSMPIYTPVTELVMVPVVTLSKVTPLKQSWISNRWEEVELVTETPLTKTGAKRLLNWKMLWETVAGNSVTMVL